MKVLTAGVFVLLFIFFPPAANAQSKTAWDSTYFIAYPKSVVLRIYSSRKYSVFRITNNGNELRYVPNTVHSLGIGFSYSKISINMAYGLGFTRDPDKGRTSRFDFQVQLYGRRWLSAIYAQSYRGYYLPLEYANFPHVTGYYIRPDLKTLSFGFARYRVFNSTRFSYKAAFSQRERQLKSAGSPVAGAEIRYNDIRADSSIIPHYLNEDYKPQSLSKLGFLSLSPGAGYAYTLVIKKNFFATASATLNLSINYTTEKLQDYNHSYMSALTVVNFRSAVGWNNDNWNVSANWIAANLPLFENNAANRYMFSTGIYRFVIARRFTPGKRLQKRLNVIDKVLSKLSDG